MSGAAPYRQTYWDWRAAANFIFGGSGSGLLLLTPLIAYFDGPVRLFLLAGIGLVGMGLGFVWLEIGKRLRAMNVFRRPNLSWMTRESYAATAVFVFGLSALWRGDFWLVLVTAVFAALFLYCQGYILLASKGIPAWREKTALPLIIATGLVEGLGLVLIASFLLLGPLNGVVLPLGVGEFFTLSSLPGSLVNGLGLAFAIGLIVRYLVWRKYFSNFGKSAPEAALKVYDEFGPYFLIGGHALPFVFTAAALPAPSLAAPGFAIAGLFAIAGGWALKFVIITRASYTQGFAIPHRPARGPRGSGGPGVKPGWKKNT